MAVLVSGWQFIDVKVVSFLSRINFTLFCWSLISPSAETEPGNTPSSSISASGFANESRPLPPMCLCRFFKSTVAFCSAVNRK